jgi:hypothetical protein
MSTTLIVLAVLAVAAGAYFLLIKKGKIEDKDGDFIADVVEDKVDSIKKEVKRRAKNVKAEIGDVKKASKELLDQASDVAEAAAGKTRKGRKPAAKKQPAKRKAKTGKNVSSGSGSGAGEIIGGSGKGSSSGSGSGKGKGKSSGKGKGSGKGSGKGKGGSGKK